ncbi:uncharacterized protein METZ01_LOCUS213186, partial [marine metagenome]
MFTGIIEETGKVNSIQPRGESFRFTLTIRKTGNGLKVGDSLAVNGCCLTVSEIFSRG